MLGILNYLPIFFSFRRPSAFLAASPSPALPRLVPAPSKLDQFQGTALKRLISGCRCEIVSPSRRLRCANQITRIALREVCVRHVGPTRSYFAAKTQFSYSISDRESICMGALSDEIAYCSAYGVRSSVPHFPYSHIQRYALGSSNRGFTYFHVRGKPFVVRMRSCESG